MLPKTALIRSGKTTSPQGKLFGQYPLERIIRMLWQSGFTAVYLKLDSREEEDPAEGQGVVLMSLHAAKGLEFPVVFLLGCEEDLLPCAGIQGEARDLEEERRLAYVGITRARERLVLTRAASRARRGKLEPRTPSRFLSDLPPEAFEVRDASRDPGEDAAARSAEVLAGLRRGLAGLRG